MANVAKHDSLMMTDKLNDNSNVTKTKTMNGFQKKNNKRMRKEFSSDKTDNNNNIIFDNETNDFLPADETESKNKTNPSYKKKYRAEKDNSKNKLVNDSNNYNNMNNENNSFIIGSPINRQKIIATNNSSGYISSPDVSSPEIASQSKNK